MGEPELINPSLPQAFSKSRGTVKGQAGGTILPMPEKGLLPRAPFLGPCITHSLNRSLGLGRTPVAQAASAP